MITQIKTYLEPSLRGRGAIESMCQSFTGWELQWMAVTLGIIQNTQDMLLLLQPSYCLSSTIQHPWQYVIPPVYCGGHSFCAPNLLYVLKGQLLGLISISFLIAKGCQHLINWNVKDNEAFSGKPKSSSTHSDNIMAHSRVIYPLASHCPSHRVNLFRKAQRQCKGLMTGLMTDHQPSCSQCSPLAAAVHFLPESLHLVGCCVHC